MVVIDKIVKSAIAPTDGKVLWLNTTNNIIYNFTDSGWVPTSANSGTGSGGFYIGTQEERLALEPSNGMVFNQVEEDGSVHRYFYEQNEWTLLANPEVHDTEEVIVMLSDNTGTVDFTELSLTVTNNTTEATHSVEIDSTGTAIIYIPIGDSYTIEFPEIEGYKTLNDITITAERYVRQINGKYISTSLGTGYIVEKAADPEVPIEEGSDTAAVDRILNCYNEGNSGSYVIDEEHQIYAKLDPEDHSKFADGTSWSGTYGNAFRHIGAAYLIVDSQYAIDHPNQGTKYFISDNMQDEVDSVCFPEEWIGIYKGYLSGTKLVSRPNVIPTRERTITQLQADAKANGTNYGIRDYKSWVKMCHLFMAKYGTRDSQGTIGMGMTKDPAETNDTHKNTLYATQTGITVSLGDGSGEYPAGTVNGAAYKQCKLFGVEAPWGQNWEFLKGIRFNGATAYVYDANDITASIPGDRTFVRNTSLSSTFLKNMVLGKYGDMIGSATNESGDSSHGYCDASWSANGENILRVGGSSNYGLVAGLFAGHSYHVFSFSGSAYGARLCFYGDINNYTLVTGAQMATANA